MGVALMFSGGAFAAAATEPPLPAKSASPGRNAIKLAPFKERLAAAKSVQVQTSILGVELDSTLEKAHEKLDPLGNAAQPSIEAAKEAEHDEGERKVLWRLTKSDFSSVLVKADDQERVTYITGFLRPGKEVPFDKIGQTEKAPILNESNVAWDVVRPDKTLIRVVARGEKHKASSITVFVVKRPGKQ